MSDYAQDEAPTALFQAELDDASVELFIQGSWKTALAFGLNIPLEDYSGNDTALTGFEDVPWTNTAELIISLWYQKKFFFELSFLQTFSDNTFLLGYEDAKAQGLREWHIGNSAIGVEDQELMSFGTQKTDVPGTHALFGSDNLQASVMARLTSTSTHTQSFLGETALNSQSVYANAWLKHRFFRLPYTNLTSIQVFIESATGNLGSDGHRYSEVKSSDILVFSSQEGLVGLKNKPTGRVLIHYETSTDSDSQVYPSLEYPGVLSASNTVVFSEAQGSAFAAKVLEPLRDQYGWDLDDAAPQFSQLQVAINGSTALLVSMPDCFSVFEDASWYAVPSNSSIQSAAIENQTQSIETNQVGTAVQILVPGESASSVLSRYPLAVLGEADWYLPGNSLQDKGTPKILLNLSESGTSTGLILEHEAIQSTIVVKKNAIPVSNFTYDPEEKKVTLNPSPGSNDLITITYEYHDDTLDPNALQLGAQLVWDLDSNTSLAVATGLEWPVTEDLLKSGTGTISLGTKFSHKTENIEFSVKLQGYWAVPNPAGTSMVQDFSSSDLTLLDSGSEFMPAPPTSASFALSEINSTEGIIDSSTYSSQAQNAISLLSDPTALDESSRAFPLMRETSTSSGQIPGWTTKGDEITVSGYMVSGPYLRSTEDSDGFSGYVAVLEFAGTSGKNWSALELRLSDEEIAALQATHSLSFKIGALENTASAHILLMTGSLPEDIDDDGTLDTRSSALGGTVLDNSAWDSPVLATSDSDSLDAAGEDRNGNDLLDTGVSGLQGLKYAGHLDANSSDAGNWKTIRWYLNSQDRRTIAASRTIRFILIGDDGSASPSLAPLAGTYGLSLITCDLPAIQAEDTSSDDIRTGIVDSPDLSAALESAYADLGVDDDLMAQVTYQLDAGDSGSAVQILGDRSLTEGSLLECYIYLPSGSEAFTSLSFQVAYGSSPVADCTFSSPLASNEWLKVQMDTANGIARILDAAGTVLQSTGISTVPGSITWDRLKLTVGNAGASSISGYIYMDEIRTSDALSRLGGTGTAKFAAKIPGTILSLEGIPLLSDLNFAASSVAETQLYAANADFLDSQTSGDLGFQTSLSATALFSYVAGSFGMERLLNGPWWNAAYEMLVPYVPAIPFRIRHAYQETHEDTQGYQNELGLHIGSPSTFDVDWTSVAKWDESTELATKSHGLSVSLKADSTLDTSVKAQMIQTQTASTDPGTAWGASWLSLFELSWDQALTRTMSLTPQIQIRAGILETSLDASLQVKRLSSGKLGNIAKLGGTLDVGGTDTDFSAALTYTRNLVFSDTPSSRDLQSDAFRLIEPLLWYQSFSLGIPFYEFLSPQVPAFVSSELSEFAQATLDQTATLTLGRQLDTQWTAILIPHEFKVSIKRELAMVRPDTSDNLGFMWDLDWKALNLLGSTGTVHAVDAYETDSLELDIGAAHSWIDQSYAASMVFEKMAITLWGLDFGDELNKSWKAQRLMLQGLSDFQDPASIVFTQGLYCRDDLSLVSQSYGVSMAWDAELPEWKPSFLGKTAKANAYLHNTETLDIKSLTELDTEASEFLLKLSSAAAFTTYPFFAEALHATSLIIPDFAYITLKIGIGMGGYGENTPSRIGLIGRLEAKLKI